MPKNIPTDLLRTFITVVDLRSHTKAARVLGRTQPAISLQVKRLEDLLETKLLKSDKRRLTVTDAGQALGARARQMLRINDEIVNHFSRESMSGWLKVGLPTDFSNAFLLEAVAQFVSENPDVRVDVESNLSSLLRERVYADQLQLAVAIAPEPDAPFLIEKTSVTPFWVVAESFSSNPGDPLPIVCHPDPCEYVERMKLALRTSGRSWRTALVATNVEGLQAAVRADIGATALTPATFSEGMRIGREDEGFPPLAPLTIGIFGKNLQQDRALHALTEWFIRQIEHVGRPFRS